MPNNIKIRNFGPIANLDIDAATKIKHPHDYRWDFAIGYAGKIYYVEIHPAYTAEVQRMIEKLKWLKHWLKEEAHQLDDLPKGTLGFNPAKVVFYQGQGKPNLLQATV